MLLLVLLGLLAGGVFKVKTKYGTIVLENVPADAEVQIDEKHAITLTRNGKVVTVTAVAEGPHRLKVIMGDQEIWSSDVTVKLGSDPVRLKMESSTGKATPTAGPKASQGKPSKPVAEETDSFFNGEDLSGWEGLTKYWSVKDGALIGSSGSEKMPFNTYLCSKKKYKDFELSFQVRLKGGEGNSGVQIRSEIFDRDKFAVEGPQCDIGWAGGQSFWGSLYGEHFGGMMKEAPRDVTNKILKPNDFNDYSMKCVGKHVTIKLNGETTVDDDFPQMPEEGIIAWQLHGGFLMEATFKNIEFREISGHTREAAPAMPLVVGVWEHSVPSKKINYKKELMPDGTITGEEMKGMKGTWLLEGSTLTLTWGDKGTLRNGIWVDKCTVSPDGMSYTGRDLENELVMGKKVGAAAVALSVPSVVGVWEHSLPSKKINNKKELMLDGTITGEGMKGTWLLEGSTLTLTWGDKGTLRNGIWVDKCTVSPDGKSYTGRDLEHALVIGKKIGSDGFVSLFNGKDLSGWETHPNDKAKWEVRDGILIGSGPVGHLFSKRGDYQDFHFRVEAMINDGGNSGQYFRAQFGPSFPTGYEAQINSTHGDPIRTGSLYPDARMKFSKEDQAKLVVKEQLHKPDEWFTQEVIARGNHIIIKVNGKTTVDFVDSKNSFTKGRFAIQQHDIGTVTKVRKIEVKELPMTNSADPFQPNSVWENAKQKMTLTVIERKGEKFLARFEIGTALFREVSGTVKEGELSWLAKDVRAIKGLAGGDNFGTIKSDKDGDLIDFVWRTDQGGSGTFMLRLRTSK